MASFKDAREMLLLSHDIKIRNDEELIVLMDENNSRNPDFNYKNHRRFNLDLIPKAECKPEFRFAKKGIPLLADA
mgnify:CR=1 FL=1